MKVMGRIMREGDEEDGGAGDDGVSREEDGKG